MLPWYPKRPQPRSIVFPGKFLSKTRSRIIIAYHKQSFRKFFVSLFYSISSPYVVEILQPTPSPCCLLFQSGLYHSIGNRQWGHSMEVFESTHVALRISLPLSQPVNCIFWPIGMLNSLVAASKLHKYRVTL